MKKYYLLLLIVLIIPSFSRAELLHGYGTMNYWTWDFSDSCSVYFSPVSPNNVDIMMFMTARIKGDQPSSPTELYVAANYYEGALITAEPDTALEELRVAPEDSSVYAGYSLARQDVTYIVKTVEGHYAKFRLILYDEPVPVIEYYYQTDGSRILNATIGTEESTWGRIKKVVLPGSN